MHGGLPWFHRHAHGATSPRSASLRYSAELAIRRKGSCAAGPLERPDRRMNSKPSRSILLVEADVIVRFALAQHLRQCGHLVIEVADGTEARSVFSAALSVEIVLADAQLAGEESGFALARWVRRHRKSIDVILMATLAHKVQVVCDFCVDSDLSNTDGQQLTQRINAMLAERKRRLRAQPKTAPIVAPRRKRT